MTQQPSTYWDILHSLALQAAQKGEVPVAALIVKDGHIIAKATNTVEHASLCCNHAEMLAIAAACKAINNKTLQGCDLYVTLEPCIMCAGAISHARVSRLYYGAYDQKAGAVDNGVRWFAQPYCNHAPEIIGGVLHQRFSTLLKQFFADKR